MPSGSVPASGSKTAAAEVSVGGVESLIVFLAEPKVEWKRRDKLSRDLNTKLDGEMGWMRVGEWELVGGPAAAVAAAAACCFAVARFL